MSARRPFGGGGAGSLFGASRGPAPPDLLWLLAVIFVTFSLRFFDATASWIAMLELSPDVWQRGFVWQAASYPFVGQGAPGIWFLLELLILFWFGRDVRGRLGKSDFWKILAWGVGTAALVAIGVEIVARLMGSGNLAAFSLLQGQRTLLVIVIAAFATLYGNATILLFFVLPIQAKWFLVLEIVFAFMGFLGSGDLGGFLGIVAAVGVVYDVLSRGGLRRWGREYGLRLEQRRLKSKLSRMRRKRGIRLVDREDPPDSDGGDDPWIH